jgi:2-octaprenyl-6-methoxyphenol hydroxylase
LIEAHDYKNLPPPGFDSRTVALSYSSRQIFEGLQLWPSIEQRGISPIEMIHISDRGHPGMTRLTANEQGVEALGYVIENRILGESLFARLSSFSNITLMAPARMQQLDFRNDRVILQGSMNEQAFQLTTRLVVAADGTESFVRKYLNISQRHWDYQQTAVIANVACDRPHNHVAYERFTSDGPMALLPLTDLEDAKNRYGLVWTVPQNRVEQVLALSDAQFRTELAVHFGERAGKFTRIGKRASYPLGLSHINEHVRHRLAFIGNAAHTLHPVAGQGFNLGLRDVAALAQVLQDALATQQDPGNLDVLQAYARWRRRDHLQTAVFTDSLVRVFSTDFTPLVLARNAGLLAMELFAPLRKRLGRHAMGYVGRASLLARGLEL